MVGNIQKTNSAHDWNYLKIVMGIKCTMRLEVVVVVVSERLI